MMGKNLGGAKNIVLVNPNGSTKNQKIMEIGPVSNQKLE